MATAPHINDDVFVSCAGIPELETYETALYRARVVDESDRQIKVSLPGGAVSKFIHKSRAHARVGTLIFELGDFDSEAPTLDPLAKSITQFCRLLVPDDYIRFIKVRSMAECRAFWEKNHGAYEYVIVVGHGDTGVLCTGMDGCKSPADWRTVFEVPNVSPKRFIFSVCKSGQAAFSRNFSKSAACSSCIAPYQSVHSAVASQFIQSYFGFRFVVGQKEKTAFLNARQGTADGTSFRLWRSGKLDMQ